MFHDKLSGLAGVMGFALAIAATSVPARGQPGFPPNDPDSWRVAGTAKILCSALFVSGRDSAEARDHVTSYFLGPKVDSITKLEVDRQRKLVRLTVANRITREAKLYGDQGCIIHQPGRDSIFFTPVRVTSALPDASTTPWPMGDVLPKTPLPAEIDTAKLRSAVDAAFATPEGFTAAFIVVYDGRIIADASDGDTVEITADRSAKATSDEAAKDLLTKIEMREEVGDARCGFHAT